MNDILKRYSAGSKTKPDHIPKGIPKIIDITNNENDSAVISNATFDRLNGSPVKVSGMNSLLFLYLCNLSRIKATKIKFIMPLKVKIKLPLVNPVAAISNA